MSGSILTTIGLSKISSSTPLDQLNVTEIAVGDGNGSFPTLSPSMTSLVNEVWRDSVSAPIRDENDPSILIFEGLIPAEVGGFTMREVGIFDDAGDMIAIGHTAFIVKPNNTAEQGMIAAVRISVKLNNASDVDVIYQDSGFIDHQGLLNRDTTDAHPAASISVSIVPDVLASDNVQDALEELATFDNTNTYLKATTKKGALETLGSSYVFVDQVLGDKYTHGNEFDDVDVFDDLLGKVYDGTATAQEIAIVDKVNTKLGLLAQ